MTIQTRPSGRALAAGVFDFLHLIEQSGQYNDQIHDDDKGVPTAGYGYALVVRVGATWQIKTTLSADFLQIGIVVTQAQTDLLNQIAANLTNNNPAANATLIEQLAGSTADIPEAAGRQLFDLAIPGAAADLRDRFRRFLGTEVAPQS